MHIPFKDGFGDCSKQQQEYAHKKKGGHLPTTCFISVSISSATLSHDLSLTVALIEPLSQDLLSAADSAAANSSSFSAATIIPQRSSTRSSGTPPTREATTGKPQARASITTLGHPSLKLGRQKISAEHMSAGTLL